MNREIMDLSERIESFSSFGQLLRTSLAGEHTDISRQLNDLINNQHLKNKWFTPGNVREAFQALADELTFENLSRWTGSYPVLNSHLTPYNVGVIMAGNIPLVGFHDFLSVLISGNNIIAKTSSKDKDLLPFVAEVLCTINPGFSERIHFTEGRLSGYDAIIATGSDNSARYFDYYFGKYPNIIRKNRNSVAVISGKESESELADLGKDVFTYFGLGCRNVSRIYIPAGYDPLDITLYWQKYSDLVNHAAYANNYDYNKAVYMVNHDKFDDTGFLLLKEERSLSSPVAVLYYGYYDDPVTLKTELAGLADRIQCVVGSEFIPFGRSQAPSLWDYADNVDIMEFLLKKNIAGNF
jgi:hypothetical protein